MSRGVAQAVDDGGKEKDEGVSGQVRGVVAKSEKVDLRVFECLENPGPGKFLIAGGVAIIPESRENEFPLFGGEELGGRGVIVDEKVRRGGHDDGQQSFLEQHVGHYAENRSGKTYDDEDPPPTAQASNPVHFGNGE